MKSANVPVFPIVHCNDPTTLLRWLCAVHVNFSKCHVRGQTDQILLFFLPEKITILKDFIDALQEIPRGRQFFLHEFLSQFHEFS